MMIAAFATLAFLATIWLLGLIVAQTVEESGGKIVAALRGRSPLATPVFQAPVPVRVSQRSVRQQASVRAQPKLRAAA
jgi:hypothetical protein